MVVATQIIDWLGISWLVLVGISVCGLFYGWGAGESEVAGPWAVVGVMFAIAAGSSIGHANQQAQGLTSRNVKFLHSQDIKFRNIDGNDFQVVLGQLPVKMTIRKDVNGAKHVYIWLANGKLAPATQELRDYLGRTPVG